MRRGAVLLLAGVALVVVAGTVAGASWTQIGGGPGRTGAIPYQGPQTNDTAFQVQLPGSPAGVAALADGQAYVTTEDRGWGEDLEAEALWRIDLATGETEKLFGLPDGVDVQTVGPELVIVEDGQDLVALEIPSREERWRAQVLADEEDVGSRSYRSTARVGDTVYVGFLAIEFIGEFGGSRVTDRPVGGVMAVDRGSGEVLWTWERRDSVVDEARRDRLDREEPRAATTDPWMQGQRVAADGGRVYSYGMIEVEGGSENLGPQPRPEDPVRYERDDRRFELWALDADDGTVAWNRSDTRRTHEEVVTPAGEGQLSNDQTGYNCCAHPAVGATATYIRLDAFKALNKADGEVIWTSPAGRTDQVEFQGSTALGISGNSLVATSEQSVYRIDATRNELIWKRTYDENQISGTFPVVQDLSTAYVPVWTNCGVSSHGIEARDLETGDLQWTWRYQPSVGDDRCGFHFGRFPAFGPGFMVWGAKDGTVNVVGETEASLGPFLVSGDRYAAPGEAVTLDLSGTQPGAFGPPTRYKVDWGDGNATPWRDDPVFQHSYDEPSEHTVRVRVGNDANQTASSFVTVHVGEEAPAEEDRFAPDGSVSLDVSERDFEGLEDPERYRVFWGDGNVSEWRGDPVFRHTYAEDGNVTARIQAAGADNETASEYVTMRVGQSPPPEPNLAQKAFAPRNQDMTFGILGVVLAVGGGAVGVARRRRKRSRLEQELEALEEGYEETKHNPGECEAFLETRKGRARSLLVDGTLDEEQVGVIENRIDEMRRELRTGVLDERFQFLPHGMVQSLKGMLADGQISTWERSTLEDLLEEDETLNEAQREKVRVLLERWSEDASGGGLA